MTAGRNETLPPQRRIEDDNLSYSRPKGGMAMAVTGVREPSGLYILRISGVFTNQDRKAMEAAGRAEIDRSSKIKTLILADRFAGWGKEDDWGDIRFMLEVDPYMEKIAVVADQKWRDPFLMYLAAGHRKAAVEFFPSGEECKARTWLG
jgi:hypothetical protein